MDIGVGSEDLADRPGRGCCQSVGAVDKASFQDVDLVPGRKARIVRERADDLGDGDAVCCTPREQGDTYRTEDRAHGGLILVPSLKRDPDVLDRDREPRRQWILISWARNRCPAPSA